MLNELVAERHPVHIIHNRLQKTICMTGFQDGYHWYKLKTKVDPGQIPLGP